MTATHELVVPKSIPIISSPADFELYSNTIISQAMFKRKNSFLLRKNEYVPEWPRETHTPTDQRWGKP